MLRGVWTPPSDKSISHRALIFASLSKGISLISNFLRCQDTYATMHALRSLGVKIEENQNQVTIVGRGLYGLKPASRLLDCRNSGTSLRLLTGLLSMQPFSSVLSGDMSLRKRPMGELVTMLRKMGAQVTYLVDEERAPLKIHPVNLKNDPIFFEPHLPSAQVKSALLLAGLYCDQMPLIKEPIPTRDHTEKMINYFGPTFEAFDLTIPGDFSSAAFMISLALLKPQSKLLIEKVGLNPTRTGFSQILSNMGANIQQHLRSDAFEPVGDIEVGHSCLNATVIEKDLVASAIDELPLVALLATQAKGTTVVKDAQMLRSKECDRIHAICEGLSALGADIEETKDGFKIEGPTPLKEAKVRSFSDHRIAMMFYLAGKISNGKVVVDNLECTSISFPNFIETVESLCLAKN